MAKYHVNADTGKIGICRADVKACPVGKAGGEHFDNGLDAQKFSDKLRNDKYNPLAGLKKDGVKRDVRSDTVKSRKAVAHNEEIYAGQKMTTVEANLRQKIDSMATNFVKLRGEIGDLSIEQGKGDPVRAQESLENAITFAAERQNTNLIEKLAKAKAYPTSVILTSNGEKVYSDQLSDVDRAFKHIEDGRAAIQYQILKASNDAPAGKYISRTDNAVVTVSITDDDVNDDEFKKLPEDIRKQLSTPYKALSIEAARDYLTDDEFSKVVKETHALDYVNGRPRDIGLENVPVRTELVGTNDADKVQNGADSVAEMYQASRKQFGGSVKSLKERRNNMAATVKESASLAGSRMDRNIFIPGRSRHNGIIVSGRQMIDTEMAKNVLDAEQLEAITKTTFRPNAKKAKEILSPEVFDKVFNKRKVSIRVVEN